MQGLQQYFWSEQEVDSRLDAIITRAFEQTWQLHEQRELPLRLAAYGVAVDRVASATAIRGIYPQSSRDPARSVTRRPERAVLRPFPVSEPVVTADVGPGRAA